MKKHRHQWAWFFGVGVEYCPRCGTLRFFRRSKVFHFKPSIKRTRRDIQSFIRYAQTRLDYLK